VLLDSELLEVSRGYHARAKDEFVIESAVPADPDALYDHRRGHRDIQDLIACLRSKGVTSKTSLHGLRKAYGLQMNARYGLTAAREMLRHADIESRPNPRGNLAFAIDPDLLVGRESFLKNVDRAMVHITLACLRRCGDQSNHCREALECASTATSLQSRGAGRNGEVAVATSKRSELMALRPAAIMGRLVCSSGAS
jgi:hypothetical protein